MVFNIYAVVVGILIALCAAPLMFFAPDFMDGMYGEIVIASIAVVVSTLSEIVGLKARLFWIPMWAWALFALGSFTHDAWGWWGPGIVGAVGVAAVAGIVVLGRKNEQEEWAQAPRELDLARALLDNPEGREQCFAHLHNAFFVPVFTSNTEQVWTHQRQVLAVANQLLEGRTQVGKEHLVGMLDRAYAAKIQDPKEDIDSDLETEVQELLEHGGHPPASDDED